VLVQLSQAPSLAPTPTPEYFVEIRDGEFVLGCSPFYTTGFNKWEMVEAAAGAPRLNGASISKGLTGPQLVVETLRRGKELGFNVVRTWVHSVSPEYALQTEPGVYNEAVFRGVDFLLDEARKAGIKLVLAMTSNWTPIGGIPQYLRWAGATDQVDFYTDPQIKDWFKDFMDTIVSRVNSINGRIYRDDPTIM
jgi:mannan endo-1,4-beta-mannosidase